VVLLVDNGLGGVGSGVCFVVSSTLYTNPDTVMVISMMVIGCERYPGIHVVGVSVVTSC
jgi:hypothetical protein